MHPMPHTQGALYLISHSDFLNPVLFLSYLPMTSISQMRKLRFRDIKWLCSKFTQKQNPNWKTNVPVSKLFAFD